MCLSGEMWQLCCHVMLSAQGEVIGEGGCLLFTCHLSCLPVLGSLLLSFVFFMSIRKSLVSIKCVYDCYGVCGSYDIKYRVYV